MTGILQAILSFFGVAPAAAANYIEDVFSTYLYTATGPSSGQTITNNIDLSGKGGMLWIKDRTDAGTYPVIVDTARGANKWIYTSSTAAAATSTSSVTAFNSNGFTLGTDSGSGDSNSVNYAYSSPTNMVSWTFRKQAKFFDVVTYTGDGVDGRTVSHSLGSTPGFIVVKRTDGVSNWVCWHRSINSGTGNGYIFLQTTAAAGNDASGVWGNGVAYVAPTSTQFTVAAGSGANANGASYVAYLFAHDAGGFGAAGTDNVISCGSFTTDGGSSFTAVNLGYEPQWLLIKASSGTSNWTIVDNMRGIPVGSNGARLIANLTDAETSTFSWANLTATGFGPPTGGSNPYAASTTYIYIAIRRGPMKTPTSGTSVFTPSVRASGTGAAFNLTGTGFPPDLLISTERTNVSGLLEKGFHDRLRGNVILRSNTTAAEATDTPGVTAYGQDGFSFGADGSYATVNFSGASYVYWTFRRAPGFFDEVCYTGTGANRTVTHNLTVAPELMIIKVRGSITDSWQVYCSALDVSGGEYLLLNDTAAKQTNGSTRFTAAPTSTEINLATNGSVNGSGNTYVAYLFATVAGVSKVGSYTGTGTTKQIDCGFTAGARFVMIKRTDSTGGWYVWDSARGIVAGNDPYLLLNSTAAEVTNTDYVDTSNAGFEISSTAPAAINANGGTYIFLAIA